MELRDYQLEVIEPALKGENIIIWLPTGAGKTRAAAYVSKRHLESQNKNKVAVLVNSVPLVEQHLKNEFSSLKNQFKITAISGDSAEKHYFSEVVKSHDLIICTAKILQNALVCQDEEIHVELTDFSLLVIDECHHTHKETTYNQIMEGYVECKLKGQQNLPQILGLTASLGTGGVSSLMGAQDHILQICANLDAGKIMSSQKHQFYLEKHVPHPKKQYDMSLPRLEDPFGGRVKTIMNNIYHYLGVSKLTTDFGTQVFEQQVVALEKEGATSFCQKTRICALHLREYNDALLINDTVRMIDAFNSLDEFYQLEKAMKDLLHPAEQYMVQVFNDNRGHLLSLARNKDYENPNLAMLQQVLCDHFRKEKSSRGIVFSQTRQSAHSLHQWAQDNEVLRELGVKSGVLTGVGCGSQIRHMTQPEQQNALRHFRNGTLNLLFSTSVAEEGLDVAECNIVVRYGLMTNEIAMMQARGRARAPDSTYSVLAKAQGKEVTREKLNETLESLMNKAIAWVQQMPPEEYRKKIAQLQHEAIVNRRMRDLRLKQLRQLHDPESAHLYCISCNTAVCHGSDLRKIENIHHVNINPNFRLYYRTSLSHVTIPRKFRDWRPGSSIGCDRCGQPWGFEIIYREITLPLIAIKYFVVETPEGRKTYKKWSKVTFDVKDFDYIDYCNNNPDTST